MSDPGNKGKWALPSVDAAQASKLVGVVAAMVIAVLLNVAVSRHYKRWDLTESGRYTLSPATVQTLRELPDTLSVWVLLGPSDPLEQSVKQLLVAYQAETTKLDVHYIDPDRDAVALEDVRKRFKLETGRTDNGHVVADAIVVVARGEQHWFVTASDMVESTGGDGTHVRPREERAITGAIRSVLVGTKTRVCFTRGHGELSPGDPEGAGALKEILEKDNYEIAAVDLATPNEPKLLETCGVVVVAGLRAGLAAEEAERLRTWLLDRGNLLLLASPVLDPGGARPSASGDAGAASSGFAPAGLERVIAPFGIALDDVVVTEQDGDLAFPGTGGIRFVGQPRAHAITTSLVKTPQVRDVPRIILHLSRSMHATREAGAPNAEELLTTSNRAFGLRSIDGAAEWTGAPPKHPGDLGGPLTLAMASERGKTSPSAAHGPRVVVLGTASVASSASFREALPYRGGPLLVESAISWLASKPQILDVPDKSPVGAGVRIDDESRSTIRRYVVIFMPAAVALIGIAIAIFRRASEGGPSKGRKNKRAPKEPR